MRSSRSGSASDGGQVPFAWTASPVADVTGRTDGLVLVSGMDITERRLQERELRASRQRIVTAGDEERRRLERNLHDGAQQRLVALSVALRLAESRLAAGGGGRRRAPGRARGRSWAQALEELRELARGIHPAVLSDRGLGPALEALAARTPIPVEVTLPEGRLPREVEAAIYYVVSESIANVCKYAQATTVWVDVGRRARARRGARARRRRRRRRPGRRLGAARPRRPGRVRSTGRLVVESPRRRWNRRPRRDPAAARTRAGLVDSCHVRAADRNRHLPDRRRRGLDAARREHGRGLRRSARRRPRARAGRRRRARRDRGGRDRRRGLRRVRAHGRRGGRGGRRPARAARRHLAGRRRRAHAHRSAHGHADAHRGGLRRSRRDPGRAHRDGGSRRRDRALLDRRGLLERLRAARPGHPPLRRARRPRADPPAPGRGPPARLPAPAEHGLAARRRAPRRDRRGLGAPARGDRPAARGVGLRGRLTGGNGRGPAPPRRPAPAGRRDHRHQDAADAHRRGPACGARHPRALSRHRRARALAVRRGGIRHRAPRARRGRRLPAQGSRRRHRPVRRPRSSASPRAARRSTRRSSASWSAGGRPAIRSSS